MKKILESSLNPILVNGAIILLWLFVLFITVLTMSGFDFPLVQHLLVLSVSFVFCNMMFLVFREKQSNSLKFSDVILIGELSLNRLIVIIRSLINILVGFKRIILLFILILLAKNGFADLIMEELSVSTTIREITMRAIGSTYTFLELMAYLYITLGFIWMVYKVSKQYNMAKVISQLKKEGIEIECYHNSNGHCFIKTKELLDSLVNEKELSPALDELYWEIKRNKQYIDQIEYHPHGKPNSLVQEALKEIQTNQVHTRTSDN